MHIPEKDIHKVFIVSLILKGVNSVIQILAGSFLLFTGRVNMIIANIIDSELLNEPDDYFTIHLHHFLSNFSIHGQRYVAFYLLSHGIVKTVLVISLLKNKLWAYPGMIITVSLFIIYQLYKLCFGYSLFLILLTIFDIFVIWLTWHEYNVTKKHIERIKELNKNKQDKIEQIENIA
jgi:uncharacterized membrane protein